MIKDDAAFWYLSARNAKSSNTAERAQYTIRSIAVAIRMYNVHMYIYTEHLHNTANMFSQKMPFVLISRY